MSQVKIPMTKKQNSIYNFIKTYKNTHDVCPTYQEIADHFGLKSRSTIHNHIHKIERRGWIKRIPGAERAIALSDSLHSSN